MTESNAMYTIVDKEFLQFSVGKKRYCFAQYANQPEQVEPSWFKGVQLKKRDQSRRHSPNQHYNNS